MLYTGGWNMLINSIETAKIKVKWRFIIEVSGEKDNSGTEYSGVIKENLRITEKRNNNFNLLLTYPTFFDEHVYC